MLRHGHHEDEAGGQGPPGERAREGETEEGRSKAGVVRLRFCGGDGGVAEMVLVIKLRMLLLFLLFLL